MPKPIRFFATNRDRQNLGRNVDRKTRIQLQKGGYHWVDMKKYMAHYLATTDPSAMPSEVIIEDSQKTIFTNFLCKDTVKRIIIGIHGFNVPFHGALTSFSVLADTLSVALQDLGTTLITEPIIHEEFERSQDGESLKSVRFEYDPILDQAGQDLTAFVGFSWPSNGKVLDYLFDRAEAVQTAPALASLISYIRTQKPHVKIHIVAHSMGNYLTCNMFEALVNKSFKPTYSNDEIDKQIERLDVCGKDAFFVDRYVLLAPDLERREVTQCDVNTVPGTNSEYIGPFYAGLQHLVQESHLFYSRYDNALKASVAEKDVVQESFQKGVEFFRGPDLQKRWENSLGLNPLPALAPSNMYSHNATALTNRTIDHGDYFDAPEIIKRMAKIIMDAG